MQKRAESQLDWIMSLALFVLYVAWFFSFIMPNITLSSNKDSLISLVQSSFSNEFSSDIKRFPIFIRSNESLPHLPIIMDFPLNRTDLLFSEEIPYIIYKDKLIFIGNISPNITTFWVFTEGNFSSGYIFKGMNIQEDRVSTKNLSLELEDSLPSSGSYVDEVKFRDTEYTINSVPFVPTLVSYNDSGFVAIYEAGTNNFNHTSFIFADNAEIFNLISSEDSSDYIFSIEMQLYRYTNYYADTLNFGEISYEDDISAVSITSDYLALYSSTDSPDSLSFLFDEDADFELSSYNDTLTLLISFPVSDGYWYRYIFSDNYSAVETAHYSTSLGVFETIRGISLSKITGDYEYLKEKWNYPAQRNFNIRIYENTTALSYSSSPSYEIGVFNPAERNVYAETQETKTLEEDGSSSLLSISYRIW